MTREEIAEKYKNTTISGLNCGTMESSFMGTACNERLLAKNIPLQIFFAKHPECSTALKMIDENYDFLNNQEFEPCPLQKDAVGKPQFVGKLCHHIKLNGRNINEVLQSFGDIGIVPSEYFGVLESGGEGRFCSFFSRIYERVTTDDPLRRSRCQLRFDGTFKHSGGDDIFFILDEKVASEIENKNLFAFKHSLDDSEETIKIKDEKFSSLSPEEQILYKTLIELSPSPVEANLYEWLAYPGGIPSKYISGIVMSSQLIQEDPNTLTTLNKTFPQATIIDIENNSIIRDPTLVEESEL